MVLRSWIAVFVLVSLLCAQARAQVCRVGCPCGNACIDCSDTCRVGAGTAGREGGGDGIDATTSCLIVGGTVAGLAVLLVGWFAVLRSGILVTPVPGVPRRDGEDEDQSRVSEDGEDEEQSRVSPKRPDKEKMSPEAREIQEAIEAQENEDDGEDE